MSIDFGPPLQKIFAALGQDATYVPAAGDQKTITVLPNQADALVQVEGYQIQSAALRLEVLKSDVASFAKGQDRIIFNGVTYIVQNARIKDALALVWMVDTYPA